MAVKKLSIRQFLNKQFNLKIMALLSKYYKQIFFAIILYSFRYIEQPKYTVKNLVPIFEME